MSLSALVGVEMNVALVGSYGKLHTHAEVGKYVATGYGIPKWRTHKLPCPLCLGVLIEAIGKVRALGRIVKILAPPKDGYQRVIYQPIPKHLIVLTCSPCKVYFSHPRKGHTR